MTRLIADEQLQGEVIGLIHADPDSGFGVIEFAIQGEAGTERGARCAGPLSDLVEGQTLRLVGAWRDHPRYGRTFEVTYYEQLVPTTESGLRSFLRSERFEEVSERGIAQVLSTFGPRAGWVIENEPDRLTLEAGISAGDADVLSEAWRQGRVFAELVQLLDPVRVPQPVVRAAFAHLGTEAVEVLLDDPFALLEVERATFAHADGLARHLGIEPTDPRRLTAGVRAAHAAARRRDGHQYLPRDECVAAAARLLGVDAITAAVGLDAAASDGDLVVEDDGVYTRGGLRAETELAEDLVRLLEHTRSRLSPFAPDVRPSGELTPGQAAAVRTAFTSPVSVLTGGPGTGKTRAIAEIVVAAEDARLNVALCAPTGRAAKRIEELVGRAASTVHRLLEARPREDGRGFTFGYGRDGDRLPHDLVICDEVSMCDTRLAATLVSAVDDGAHLVLVGDPDQLPSVGPGDVLADVLTSGVVPHVLLTDVHRQAAASRIVGLANEVNAGEVGELPGVDGDVFMAEEPVRDRIVPRIVDAVAERIPAHLGVTPEQIQVLAPVYRGPAGVDALNAGLRAALNPSPGPAVGGVRVGDRVMQTRNDPERDVSNGDIGHVVDVAPGDGELRVVFPSGEVTYDTRSARDLVLAWAVTVHKSQGGEWPVVVFVCERSHGGMLWRNLAYTAVTRAQDALVVVGQRAALRAAAAQDRPSRRHTRLASRLRAASEG
jgi:exodeoxyribonuclease V alpha subunit